MELLPIHEQLLNLPAVTITQVEVKPQAILMFNQPGSVRV